jgi:hypothetical protein
MSQDYGSIRILSPQATQRGNARDGLSFWDQHVFQDANDVMLPLISVSQECITLLLFISFIHGIYKLQTW